ncbi:MAG: glutamate-1-semialdehyde 2,1-aminomutase [Bacteroidia bacterium]|nr:MAG: glutamate-1-semialdehyde 2,1-aminomutase [Bacteroidia bacterium]
MNSRRSKALFEKARKLLPGGVNSPVRAFKSVGGSPLFIRKARGAYVWDADANRFIDYVGSWGPMLFGHAHPRILRAVKAAAGRGTSFGAPTETEIRIAELIVKLVPSIEVVRMVNSGTEATMSAIRLARAFTGRPKIVKFEGCYHGHADAFLMRAGSGALTFGTPDSPGVPRGVAEDTLMATYNDIDSVHRLIEQWKDAIAAVIVEPVVGNMGCIPPKPGFLASLRRLCKDAGILLIFDEVMTGFRVTPGGAQELYGVTPDLTTLGKIIGGGLPVGAYGGRRDLMKLVAPEGPVYQAGTLSGNPLAMAAGLEMLKMVVAGRAAYQRMEKMGKLLEDEIRHHLLSIGKPYTLNRVGSMFTVFFTEVEVIDYASAKTSDTKAFASYHRAMLEEGIYLPPSQFEAAFLSTAHTEREIEKTIRAFRRSVI